MSDRIQALCDAQEIVKQLRQELWSGPNGYAYNKLIRVSLVLDKLVESAMEEDQR